MFKRQGVAKPVEQYILTILSVFACVCIELLNDNPMNRET